MRSYLSWTVPATASISFQAGDILQLTASGVNKQIEVSSSSGGILADSDISFRSYRRAIAAKGISGAYLGGGSTGGTAKLLNTTLHNTGWTMSFWYYRGDSANGTVLYQQHGNTGT